jgi:transcriptional regulator with XRE-family HTH domain
MTRRHTRAEIDAILDQRDRKGLTYEELAERTGVAKSTLSWWSWRRRREGGEREGGRRLPRFAEVVTTPEPPRAGRGIELTTAAGLELRVPPGFDEETLARVLALLARGC